MLVYATKHVLVYAYYMLYSNARIMQEKFAYSFVFMAKWLSLSFDQTILRNRGWGRRPSCPPIFWLLKKATRTFSFINERFY